MTDWSPGAYARFRGLRLRPALDLLAQVPDLPPGGVVDLGCGNGAVAEPLRARFADRPLIGVDASPAMLAEAGSLGLYDRLDAADAALWAPPAPPALIFSNALLHWLPDHGRLMPRLAQSLVPGGVLAVQMPGQHDAPSHSLLRTVAAQLFPGRFPPAPAPVALPADYARLLAPQGEVLAWETEYIQRLPAGGDLRGDEHPVRAFTASTAMRPFLARLDDAEAARFVAAYDAALHDVYPAEPDGTVLFPFRRVFFVLTRLA